MLYADGASRLTRADEAAYPRLLADRMCVPVKAKAYMYNLSQSYTALLWQGSASSTPSFRPDPRVPSHPVRTQQFRSKPRLQGHSGRAHRSGDKSEGHHGSQEDGNPQLDRGVGPTSRRVTRSCLSLPKQLPTCQHLSANKWLAIRSPRTARSKCLGIEPPREHNCCCHPRTEAGIHRCFGWSRIHCASILSQAPGCQVLESELLLHAQRHFSGGRARF